MSQLSEIAQLSGIVKSNSSATAREVGGLLRGLATLPGVALPGGPPKSDGSPVRVIPGFLTDDWSTLVIRGYLSRLGYDVRGWGLGRNRGEVRQYVSSMRAKIAHDVARTGRPIRIVGWSLGGVIGREVARSVPEQVHQVVTLGSPVVDGAGGTVFADYDGAAAWRRDAASAKQLTPLHPPVSAIYSKSDQVVGWQNSIDSNPRSNVEHIEVTGTHSELGFSAPVLRLVGEILAR